jgi:hypothetical protein
VATLILADFLFGVGLTIFSVGQVSLRQGLTPDHLQGRMNATMAFIAALGELLSVGWLLVSPLPALREQPALG